MQDNIGSEHASVFEGLRYILPLEGPVTQSNSQQSNQMLCLVERGKNHQCTNNKIIEGRVFTGNETTW